MSDTDATESEAEGKPTNAKDAWTIKGMPAHQRENIKRAAHRNSLTVAGYMWMAHERMAATWPPPGIGKPGADPGTGPEGPPMANLSQLELLELAIKLVGTPIAKGNGGLAKDLRDRIMASLNALNGATRNLLEHH